MSDARASAFRLRLLLLLTLTSALALGSFWLLDIMRRGAHDTFPTGQRVDPDYYVEQFNFVRVAKTGHVQYHISGIRMTHNPQDDSYEIQQPVIKSLSANQPPMTIRAERALADPHTSEVQLFDDVQMDRPAAANVKRMRLASDYLLVLTDEDIVKTHRPVELVFGNSVLKGIGMIANQATREFRLASQVHGNFPPPAAR